MNPFDCSRESLEREKRGKKNRGEKKKDIPASIIKLSRRRELTCMFVEKMISEGIDVNLGRRKTRVALFNTH